MPNEWLTIGPPGTGKTTYLARMAERAVKKWGPGGVLICSLTKAAAREAAGRETGINEENVGTLHAICYRALRHPDLVENKHLEAWNKYSPQFQLSKAVTSRESSEEDVVIANDGDKILAKVDLLRARMTPPELWPHDAKNFYDRWIDWKNKCNLVDFTDLIENALHEVPLSPFGTSAILVDEYQDHSRLEVALIKKWAENIDQVVYVGDPDQSLYHWRGADPDSFKREGMRQKERKHEGDDGSPLVDASGNVIGSVRSKSFRVPRQVHRRAERLIESIPDRAKISYDPTGEEGEVLQSTFGYNRFEFFLDEVYETMSNGKRIMILASCEFMLRPVIKVLRENGIPYGNPFTDRWNPLRSSKGVSMRDRILSFIRPGKQYYGDKAAFWTSMDVKRFALAMRSEDVLIRGGKKILEQIEDLEIDNQENALKLIQRVFKPEVLPLLAQIDIEWFCSNLLAKDQETAKFPVNILRKFGPEYLENPPSVYVGTIHSVKGGEAETVILFPDLSPQGYQQFRMPGWMNYDSVCRMFYVGMTRAREKLIIGGRSGAFAANI